MSILDQNCEKYIIDNVYCNSEVLNLCKLWLEHLKKEIGKQNKSCFWRKKEAPKHRYIQILGQNIRFKASI